jgi:hypothetical protein
MDWFKIVEVDNKNRIKTLFHGNNGSRILKVNKWLQANLKLVKDGTCKTEYLSGWHIVPSFEECQEYLKYFVHVQNKRIVKCKAKVIRPKSHSRYNIYLAEYIKIQTCF